MLQVPRLDLGLVSFCIVMEMLKEGENFLNFEFQPIEEGHFSKLFKEANS